MLKEPPNFTIIGVSECHKSSFSGIHLLGNALRLNQSLGYGGPEWTNQMPASETDIRESQIAADKHNPVNISLSIKRFTFNKHHSYKHVPVAAVGISIRANLDVMI